jgi:hypothetical protein
MKKTLLVLTFGLMIAPAANALPDIQLFIEGATYDWSTKTWVSTSSSVNFYVISAKHAKTDIIVSMALAPYDDPSGTSVDFGGTIINPDDWIFGYAPIDNIPDDWNGGEDLPRHGIYPTWFAEVHTGAYDLSQLVGDVQPDENDDYWDPSSGTGMANKPGQYKVFSVDVTGPFTYVHFDAYTLNLDGTVDKFAPFSHDASIMPEPATVMLMGSGLLGLGLSAIRHRKR